MQKLDEHEPQPSERKLSSLIRGNDLIVAPVALNPIMARLAEEAGFKAIYLSGGSLGWLKCVTEANLTLPELAEVAVDMRAACKLPIVLDAGGGWGDPVHVHRTIALSEAAGFSAIEIEDQLLPRRVEHHVGIDHLIPTELMLKKIAAARDARTDPDLVIIARTNARRVGGLDEAMRRAEAFHKAGADMLFCYTRSADELRIMGERLPPPLMMFAPPDGFGTFALSERDLARLGYRLAASSGTAFAAMVKAVRQSYQCLAQGRMDPFLGPGGADKEMKAAQETCGLDRLLRIERATMKDA
ncbi:MAG TPA: isocitrate lyase/PEP mutase family protein [Xanthobacteraceae bacterium]